MAKLDWLRIAKAAGEHGIRYRMNSSLKAFLRDIADPAPASNPPDHFADAGNMVPVSPAADMVLVPREPSYEQLARMSQPWCCSVEEMAESWAQMLDDLAPASPLPGLREAVIEECAKFVIDWMDNAGFPQGDIEALNAAMRALSRPVSEREDGQ